MPLFCSIIQRQRRMPGSLDTAVEISSGLGQNAARKVGTGLFAFIPERKAMRGRTDSNRTRAAALFRKGSAGGGLVRVQTSVFRNADHGEDFLKVGSQSKGLDRLPFLLAATSTG